MRETWILHFVLPGSLLALPLGCGSSTPRVPESHVEWRTADAPTDRPIAVFVDAPEGPMDLFARDPDVTTFLNDRFDPLLVTGFGNQPSGTAAIYSADGCVLITPFVPTLPSDWINAANRAINMPGGQGRHGETAAVRSCAR